MLGALAGHDAADPASSREPVPDYTAQLRAGVRGLKIGVPRDYFLTDAKPEVASAFESALDTLRKLGAEVRDVTIPSIWSAPAFMVIMLSEAYSYHARHLRTQPKLYGEVLREKLLAGALFTADEYVQAQRLRSRLRARDAHGARRASICSPRRRRRSLPRPSRPRSIPTSRSRGATWPRST